MAITSIGYDGTINEVEFAKLMAIAGLRYAVNGPTDFQAAAVPGNRQVTVGPGIAYGVGVKSSSSANELVTFPTPSAGAWHLVIVRRDWAANTSVVMAIAGATTTTVTPTSPPTSYPAGLNQNPGVLDDQPIAWVWVNAGSTALSVYDLRTYTLTERLAGIASQLANLVGSVATLANLPTTVGGLADAIAALPGTLTVDSTKVTNQGAMSVGNSQKVGGRRIFVQATAPTDPADGDLWFW